MSSIPKRDRSTLLWAGVASLFAWLVPVVGLLMLPLEYLNAHLHELFHALAAVGTGGRAEKILVFPDASGVTPIYGGSLAAVASAGYVGAALAGAALIVTSGNAERSRLALRVTSIALALSMVLWVRGSPVGVGAGLLWIAILWFLASKLSDRWVMLVTAFVGLQQCLRAAQSLFTLIDLSLATGAHTDALLMQQATLIPAVVWAALWTAFSFVLMGFALRSAWKG